MKHDADVIVTGAGPAGCTLAYLLASQGRRVIVLDREDGPTFKVGESLLPEGVGLCHRMGLEAELERGGHMPKWGARFVLTESAEEGRYPFSEALRAQRGYKSYQVKRRDFDDLLHRHARKAGAEFRWETRVAAIDLEGQDGVSVRLEEGETLAAGFAVDATGQGHLLARRLGLRKPLPGLAKVALFGHFEGIPHGDGDEAGDITILWSRNEWVWLIPFADGTTSVGVVGDPARMQSAGTNDAERFASLCSATESHRARLSARVPLFPLQRRADFSYECSRLAGPRFLLVGDAAGFIDPLFSSGVFLAQQSAFLAERALTSALEEGRSLSEEEQRTYTDTQKTAIRRFHTLVKSSYENNLIELAVRSRRREGMRRSFISLLAGDVYDESNPLLSMGLLEKVGRF